MKLGETSGDLSCSVEDDRVAALERYAILDTPVESFFDEVVELAADVCETPLAVVNFVARDRQWFKAERGIGARELPLDVSICRHAILQSGVFVVPDLTQDPRFANNPLVAQQGGLRFYAGALLETPGGVPIGTVCVLDTRPRPEGLSERQQRVLSALARQVMSELELRRIVAEGAAAEQAMRTNAERVQLALDAGAIIGTWFWDLPSDRFTIDEQFARSFGIAPERVGEGLSLEQVVETVHPNDKAGLAAAIEEVIGRGGPYAHQYRVRRADGKYYWIEANGRVDFDSKGVPKSFPGVLLDVEEKRAVQAERDRALRLLQNFAEAVPGVVYAKDRQGRMLVANRGTTDLIGKPPEEFLGRTDLEFLDDQDQARVVMENDRRIMQSGETEQIEEEVRLADGSAAVWLSTKAPMRNEAGEIVGLIGSSVDITDRREAEERERLLAREVDHRAKNLLGVVQSVVQLTRAETIRDFKDAVAGRIQALARAHSLLAAGRWEGVELEHLVREELAPFLRPGTERVRISGDNLRLKPAASQSLALALHELATNAVKYGALSRENGTVEVSWRVDSTGSQAGGLLLNWIEEGGPTVAPPTQSGFGSTVIRSSTERQLGAELRFDWNPAGLRCRMLLPLDQLSEALPASSSVAAPVAGAGEHRQVEGVAGKCVLLVEDEALIALEMEDTIRDLGCDLLGPAASVEVALQLIAERVPDAAVLDVNVGGERSDRVAALLTSKGVPFAFCTGYSDTVTEGLNGTVEPLSKPFDSARLAAMLQRLLAVSQEGAGHS